MQKVALASLGSIVKEVLSKVPREGERAALIALEGNLGAGKTTFTQMLAKELGVTNTVQSPTYVLMKSYPINFGRFTKLIHIDAYRLKDAKEFEALKPSEFLNSPTNLVCIEWPERVAEGLPKPDVSIKFSADGASEGERYIEVV